MGKNLAYPGELPVSQNLLKTFSFLNVEHTFSGDIDWNLSKYGKLWTYNLNYFDFILQLEKDEAYSVILNFLKNYPNHKDGLESYPTSLRIINLVLLADKIDDHPSWLSWLIETDLKRLSNNLEYHLLGNHLLENALALLAGSAYLKDNKTFKKGQKLLIREVKEQYLEDGSHYERSPMYHMILLDRMVDTYSILSKHKAENQILGCLKGQIESCLAYAEFIHVGKHFPLFNDSAHQIAPELGSIRAKSIGLGIGLQPALEQGLTYKKLGKDNLLCYFDVGEIGPSYQPGHAHADSLGIVIFSKDVPIIVDPGVSTYETNDRRSLERSTSVHNVICLGGTNSSEIWGGFRVGARAKTTVVLETRDKISASHSGYQSRFGIVLNRTVTNVAGGLQIDDNLEGVLETEAVYRLHLHPNVKVDKIGSHFVLDNDLIISFEGLYDGEIKTYQYCTGFNKLTEAKKIEGLVGNRVKMIILKKD